MNYTERLDLGEGQWAVLLTRLPADREHQVRLATTRERDQRKSLSLRGLSDPAFIQIVRDAMLWECQVKDYLTGNDTSDIGKADPKVSDQVGLKAVELYVLWYAEANPGPKGSPGTANQTPTTETDQSPSATDEPQ